MWPIRHLGFKGKFISIVMVVSVLTMLLSGIVFTVNNRIAAENTMVYILSSQAKIIAANATAALTFGDRRAAKETLSTLSTQVHVISSDIFDVDNKLFASYVGQDSKQLYDHHTCKHDGYIINGNIIDLHTPVLLDGESIGNVSIQASLDEIYANIIGYSAIIFLASLPILGLALYLSTLLQKSVTQPIQDITRITGRIRKGGEYSLRVHKSSDDELGSVVDSINDMLDQIELRDQQLADYTSKLEVRVKERTGELELLTEQFRHQAYHDELTALPNRALFIERLNFSIDQSKRYQQSHALLFLDLDGFKEINDVFGHDVGDAALKVIAERLLTHVRASDTVCRFGGDEFAVLLNDVDGMQSIENMADKILAAIAAPMSLVKQEIYLSASIGICFTPGDSDQYTELLKYADTAMYHAKQRGKNNYQFYTADMHTASLSKLTTENELRQALSKRQFLLHYQPKVDVDKKMVTGVEVLLRWQHPQRGLLMPEQFIDLAESSGLIIPIGNWLTRESCRQIARWRSERLPIPGVAINLSMLQLYQDDLVDLLKSCISKNDIQAVDFQLELTESTILDDTGRGIKILDEMKALGVSLAIDDFGTGYSSLNQLRNMPIDILKIDRSFVHGMVDDAKNLAVVEAIIALARAMKLKVIAEGVEEYEEVKRLKELGCYEIQGFYFSPPVAAEELPDAIAGIEKRLADLEF